MTNVERLESRLLSSLKRIVGLHPKIASSYRPGWTKDLPPIEAEAFKGKPRKRRKAA